jgi:hypothetical protein
MDIREHLRLINKQTPFVVYTHLLVIKKQRPFLIAFNRSYVSIYKCSLSPNQKSGCFFFCSQISFEMHEIIS